MAFQPKRHNLAILSRMIESNTPNEKILRYMNCSPSTLFQYKKILRENLGGLVDLRENNGRQEALTVDEIQTPS
ncbi:hypothetical protein TKK_0017613 [Trichogramma kaykai]|uniref:Uncharacterized protein n=1 Tax=Trichogramma kaykai TaxID=54128 RepID=A0ABD2W2B1_9HYME